MPGRKAVAVYGGRAVEGDLMSILSMDERPQSYLLEDGSSLTVRTAVLSVIKIPGEYDGEGNPVYVVKTQPLLSVASPAELRKKPQ